MNEMPEIQHSETYKLNHTASHVLAEAILKLYPHAKLTIGPAIDEGFYYDIDFGSDVISSKDFLKIKKEMSKIIKANKPICMKYKSRDELLNFYQNNPFKLEIINKISGDSLQVAYTGENFFDLCKGGHIKSTAEIKAFDLLKISGTYWRGDAKNPALTRIYGIAFSSKDELDEYLKLLEYRKNYDHRKLGMDLCLFGFSSLIGAGLPIWLENGYLTRELICKFVNDIQKAHGVEMVKTPILGTKDLYITSGHWDHYRENIFPAMKVENSEYVLRPMTCPHHIMIYKKTLWSYKNLPKIYGENAILHRYEHSGGLYGLERVRSMELIDNHAFCTPEQIESVVKNCYNMIKTAMQGFNIKFKRVDLSLYDPENKEKFYDDPKMWQNAQTQLKQVLQKLNIDYVEMVGEAAFYGPKIDFQMETITKKLTTVGTIQLDFLLPRRFELEYINAQGQPQQPIMIHLGIIGTLERFFAILLEEYKGILPFWLAPVQVVILPINLDLHLAFSYRLKATLMAAGIRVQVDERNERLGNKIRVAQTSKIPYQIVIGDDEVNNPEEINFKSYGKQGNIKVSLKKFITDLQSDNAQPPVKV